MQEHYQHLGVYSDWVAVARKRQPLYPIATPGAETQLRVREVLGFSSGSEAPLGVQTENRWECDGLMGEESSWSVGYGPRTRAFLFKPVHAREPLPALVALHDHGAFKFYGKEKIAKGRDAPVRELVKWWEIYYGGRPYANALASEGFVVLVPDTFLWGSRRFPLDTMPEQVQGIGKTMANTWPRELEAPPEIAEYNVAAAHHEHWVSKYCNILGTSLAGVVSYEDRVAVNYLLSRPDVLSTRIGCIGLSGGGNRAAMLNATHDRISAAVIVGLMSTYEDLLDCFMSHTWMLFPFNWARHGDWPDLAACRAPSPLLVQYDLQDELFSENGMRAAHERLACLYATIGHSGAYTGQFYPGPHKFDLEMQAAAFEWLKQQLRVTG